MTRRPAMNKKILLVCFASQLLWACDHNPKPEVRTTVNAPLVEADDATRFHDTQTIKNQQINTSVKSAQSFTFNLPEKWVELPAKNMRDINIGFSEEENAQCYLTILSGQGGGLLDNVNRWRSELGQGNIKTEDLASLSKVPFLNDEGYFISIQGSVDGKTEDQTLAIILLTKESFYSLKFIGPRNFVTSQEKNFLAFAKSIKETEHQHSHTHSHKEEKKQQELFTYQTPENWNADTKNEMRYANFTWPEMGETQCYITVLPIIPNPIVSNINRWRGQINLPALTSEEEKKLETIATPLGDCTFVDLKQKDADEKSLRTLGGIIITSKNIVFIKMTGTSESVALQLTTFRNLIKTFKQKEAY